MKGKFKDSIYFGNDLAEDLINPSTGKVIWQKHRLLTKKCIEIAESKGIAITEDMFFERRRKKNGYKKGVKR